MRTAVPPRLDFVDDLQRLAGTAGRVLGSDAVAILAHPPGQAPRVISSHGLSRRDIAELEGETDLAEYLEREYENVLSAGAIHDGELLGSIHGLQRTEGDFDHPELIGAFAVQVALAIAMGRRPPAVEEWLETWGVLDRLVLSVHSLAELSEALTEVLGPLFGNARCGVMIADRQRNVLQTMPGAFGAPEQITASHRMSVFDPRSNSARVLITGRPYISNTSEGDNGIRQEYVDVFRISRLLSVPLRDVGVLHIVDGDEDFNLDDLERALALAPRVASIMELATRLFAHQRQQRLEETLARVAVSVASGEAIADFLPAALQELCEATEANLLALVSEDGPTISARHGARNEELERAVLDEAGGEPGMRAYVVGPEKPGDPGWAAFYVPVYLSRTRVGTLAALRTRGEPFARAERESFQRAANLAALAYATERYQQQRAQVARLQERQRIADDLHDDVAQILFAAQLCLDSVLENDALEEDVTDRIAHARGLLIRGDTTIRNVIHKLSSPQRAADLGTRLASMVAGVEDEFAIGVHLQVDDDAATLARSLRRTTCDAMVKIAREALVNAAKHAGPCRVGVTLATSKRERLVLTIADDGRGLGTRRDDRHGLAMMRGLLRDHGGTLRVSVGEGGVGTRVTASLPVG